MDICFSLVVEIIGTVCDATATPGSACNRADADLSLWTKKTPPKNAFEDQVVWITGASQVCVVLVLSGENSNLF